ncbi:hypothetical protein WJX74_000886 [Apatococcus lobatus]|uniref:RRM domain-containing protein n=1 Tax=Apatococcus lobatus TaxID=904363 RepID=A0AAW1RXZ3_9CHLO
MGSRGTTVYVGNLPNDTREREVEELFDKYGRIRDIDLKLPGRPPAFAFVEFDDPRDASDAVKYRDGYDFGGSRLRVELAHSGQRGGRGGFGGPPPFRGGGGHDRGYDRGPPPSRGGGRGDSYVPSKRSEFRVQITGLPRSASWQDLKDHMRPAGDITFSQVFKDRDGMVGVCDYSNKEDLERAIRKLDRSYFRNPFDEVRIRVRADRGRSPSASRSRSYSRSYSRSVSRSRSPVSRSRSARSASRSVSRSRSPRSASRSASPAKSPRSASRSPSPGPANGAAAAAPMDP